MSLALTAVCVAVLLTPATAPAQEAPAATLTSGTGIAAPHGSPAFRIAPAWLDKLPPLSPAQSPDQKCEGCPGRRPVYAAFEVFGINVLFNLMNRFRPPEERDQFTVGPESWWNNPEYGFDWDDNAFRVNQIGHPYLGGLHFNAARSNGLSFWESAPHAAFGSATWEYFGEMLYRAGWLVRDTTKSGGARTNSEILAMLIDPIAGANRFLSGEAKRTSDTLRVDGVPVARLAYTLHYLHVVSGMAGDHLAQSIGADALVPLRRQLRLGGSAEYIRRNIYYDYENDVDNKYRQFRVDLALVNK